MELTALSEDELKVRLTGLEEAYANEQGRTAEVYARIVGYYRSVRNWNAGKRKEFGERAVFGVAGDDCGDSCGIVRVEKTESTVAVPFVRTRNESTENSLFAFTDSLNIDEVDYYQFFYRTTCPNCIPMKELLKGLSVEGSWINVDEEAGLAAAADKRIFAAPTVVFYDASGAELYRSSRAEELRGFFVTAA